MEGGERGRRGREELGVPVVEHSFRLDLDFNPTPTLLGFQLTMLLEDCRDLPLTRRGKLRYLGVLRY